MGRIWVVLRTAYGELGIEGNSIQELRESLKSIGVAENQLERVLSASVSELKEDKISTEFGEMAASGTMPPELIAKLPKMSNKDLVLAILLFEKAKATKRDLILRSDELGKPIPEGWMDKNFARDMKGIVSSVLENDQTLYRLSERGKLVAKSRMQELEKSA